MPIVLVTRPEQAGIELCQQLNQLGVATVYHPLIDIIPGSDLADLSEALQACDLVIAVSQHAVEQSHHYLQTHQHSWPATCHYVAIGQKTAQCLSKVTGQAVNYPLISDSEHLLALEEFQSMTQARVLILRGNGGRELIYDTLTHRGAKVSYKEVYQRVERPFDAQACLSEWQNAQVDTMIVTSSQQLTYFVSQFGSQLSQWITQLRLLVPSDRTAHEARLMGFNDVIATGSASNSALVAALQP
ncbi:uroporphyrinogen-III synthase [Vibrio tritonius]|uniref:Uroporphyrinogen-III synthase n=1 Tax=Vibrio tritonius TaxID=1435069 RepID=A0ABS7YIC9_9VIBR|nr:uroporphyrinogen-III synthase [Vibrio tritonius]MCA2015430.1 uroporphyrinogen-III synthase [Vibrio tritonius]